MTQLETNNKDYKFTPQYCFTCTNRLDGRYYHSCDQACPWATCPKCIHCPSNHRMCLKIVKKKNTKQSVNLATSADLSNDEVTEEEEEKDENVPKLKCFKCKSLFSESEGNYLTCRKCKGRHVCPKCNPFQAKNDNGIELVIKETQLKPDFIVGRIQQAWLLFQRSKANGNQYMIVLQ